MKNTMDPAVKPRDDIRIFVLNGPNLNLLGVREPELYGKTTLDDIVAKLLTLAKTRNCELVHFQSNHEGELIDVLQKEYMRFNKESGAQLALIVNLAAYSHTSIALLDALTMFTKAHVPLYEVHLTNIFRREAFRNHSFVSNIAEGVISGLGAYGYEVAMHKILDIFQSNCNTNTNICSG